MIRAHPIALAAALSVSAVATVCAQPGAAVAAHPLRAQRPTWIVFDRGNSGSLAVPPLPSRAHPFVYVDGTGEPPVPRTMVAADLFTSYSAFRRALHDKQIPQTLRYVAYDPERWPKTPGVEQLHPRRYMEDFTLLARRHGLQTILAPARDLMLVHDAKCHKRPGVTLDQAFLHCNLAAGAKGATLFVIQSAPEETTAPTFRALLRRVSTQVRRSSPATIIVATLETGRIPVAHLLKLADRSLRYVEGFEVNTSPSTMRTTRELIRRVGRRRTAP